MIGQKFSTTTSSEGTGEVFYFNSAEDRGMEYINKIVLKANKDNKKRAKEDKKLSCGIRAMGGTISMMDICFMNGLRKMWAIMSDTTLIYKKEGKSYSPDILM